MSILSRQCLDRRIPDQETLRAEVAAWEAERNGSGTTVNWRFTTADARIKLKHLYPSIEPTTS
ncbi:MAG: Mobile element protein [uncultured Chloroflexia bacterium]|uniref:Mobile element protein n=1 Tax=uncultured Chloroflexia bacterium TaxID=1672391 RepID=A0A6J4IMJ5_9CHLR|nr:MAG: Mobile element protein [uncultured Chloroflexia bacterium]